jgi:hypothetical protein
VPAGTLIGRHTHPGIENTYVLEGSGELMIEGNPSRHLQTGDVRFMPVYSATRWRVSPTGAANLAEAVAFFAPRPDFGPAAACAALASALIS